jgi:hypothetical protein
VLERPELDLAADFGWGALLPDPPDRFELWARGFFEGPHVFIVEPTVPTRREQNGASLGHILGRMRGL